MASPMPREPATLAAVEFRSTLRRFGSGYNDCTAVQCPFTGGYRYPDRNGEDQGRIDHAKLPA